MLKIVMYLDGEDQAKLERVSKLMARNPQDQAYVVLMNGLEDYGVGQGDDAQKEIVEIRNRLARLMVRL
jgi:hypothetical protein